MRNGLGFLNIYFLGLGPLTMTLLMAAAGIFVVWKMIIPHGLVIWSWAVPLAAAIFGGLAFFFFSYFKVYLKDIREGFTSVVGNVRRKWVVKASTIYGLVTNYRISTGEDMFEVSEKIYNWLALGEEVRIIYWPNARKVCRVDKLRPKT